MSNLLISKNQLETNKKLMEDAETMFSVINEKWKLITLELVDFGILKPLYIEIEPQSNEYIGIQKRNGEWAICYGIIDKDKKFEWTRILDTTLQIRIKFFEYIYLLPHEIIESNKEVLADMRKNLSAKSTD